MHKPTVNTAILFDHQNDCWKRYNQPVEVITAQALDEVLPALACIEECVASRGLHAVGFLSYEAAPAFDTALTTSDADGFPPLWFGLYHDYEKISPARNTTAPDLDWQPSLDEDGFLTGVDSIKQAIARGETYQVNYTFPLLAGFKGDTWEFFKRLACGQQARYAAYIDTGRHVICSASPELFFELDGDSLVSRPMKGTAARGLTLAEDREQREQLRLSEKDRAENVMILDMVRNDLGRLPGGPVEVLEEFALEKYPSVWQMTSTAATRSTASIPDIFHALFPCASITGAPKVHTMKLIGELEEHPRKIYTGAIGHISPNRRARFSVAIRTALIDRDKEMAEYGVGAGITWGSDPKSEYRECLLKGHILSRPQPDFELLETLLWTDQQGYALLEEHLQRICASAEYFDFRCSRDKLLEHLDSRQRGFPSGRFKVRLLLDRHGHLKTDAEALEQHASQQSLRIALAGEPVDPGNPFLYHKTTHRNIYQRALQGCPGVDEVLLWNTRGELTEACNYNLVMERDGALLTPPVSCGLLAGTMRSRLLAEGKISESVLKKEDLFTSEKLWLVNSVRGWREASLS